MPTDAAKEQFEKKLAEGGLRMTSQRQAIFNAAVGRTEHFTAEELLDYARRIDASVSRATVYRALPILVSSGVLREVDIGKNIKFYLSDKDANAQKAQVICEDCNRIFEIAAPFLDWYGKSVCSKVGLEPTRERLQVHATCPTFRKSGKCERAEAGGITTSLQKG